MAKILSVGPNRELLASRSRALLRAGHDVRGVANRAEALELAKTRRFEVVLICNEFSPAQADELAADLEKLIPRAPIVFAPEGSGAAWVAEIEDMIHDSAAPRNAA